ncbi:MAG: flagellar protein export ATPase FliI [delta proteobacterium MLS_D]|nr:MAG: flagellar protein export ATPase FliI [delta proteobacterium MLS_D]
MNETTLQEYFRAIDRTDPLHRYGKISDVRGLILEGHDPGVQVGELCSICPGNGKTVGAEVVGFRQGRVIIMPLDDVSGIGPGSRFLPLGRAADVTVGEGLLGRVINGMGIPIDDRGPLHLVERYPLYAEPINPLRRARIREPMDLGIRSINSLLSCGKGQRMGIFSGSGVGKSYLLGMMARNARADVNVIGLIGERGREVREFIEKNLGEAGLERSVVVVATSDSHPLVRVRAAYVAASISEYFRDRGKDVFLLIDSLTRFAMSLREVGLSLGEPPTTKGYTPSVFSLLPKLIERTGNVEDGGSVTGLYTVLVEGDDFNEPVADAARSLLDGHIVLSRELAARNQYPAVDVLESISRVMADIVDDEHRHKASELMDIMAAYRKAEDLINIGAYVTGSNPRIDRAVAMIDRIQNFLRQDINESADFASSKQSLFELLA